MRERNDDKKKEFIVSGVVAGSQVRVVGRCGDVAVHVGDVFDALYRYQPPNSLADYARAAPRACEEHPLAIRIEAIESYGQNLGHLSSGMTGSMHVTGIGCEHIGPNVVLGSAAGATPVENYEVEQVP